MKQLSIAEQARVFAVDRHGDLQYGQDLPYAWHLSKVADLAIRLGYSESVQAAGWLHDTVEDTDMSLDEICRP